MHLGGSIALRLGGSLRGGFSFAGGLAVEAAYNFVKLGWEGFYSMMGWLCYGGV